MDFLDQNFLWASLIWGALGTGYFIYGLRQKAPFPLLGGLILSGASFFIGSWILMSLTCAATLVAVHWLHRRFD